MKKSLIGALVVTMALLPSFASATNTAYDVEIGQLENYVVPGTLLVEPTLSQTHGDAMIDDKLFLGAAWSVDVRCLSTSSVDCDGFIVS